MPEMNSMLRVFLFKMGILKGHISMRFNFFPLWRFTFSAKNKKKNQIKDRKQKSLKSQLRT